MLGDQKFPSGFFFVLLLLLLFLAFSTPSHGQEIVISETEWNGFKLSYAQLKRAHQFLSDSLETSQSTLTELNRTLSVQWLQLNTAKNSAAVLASHLLTAQTQAELLETQLQTSVNSLTSLNTTMRREKIKAGLIGGGVGLVLGAIITGLIIGLTN